MKKHLTYLLPALFLAGCAQENMSHEPENGGGGTTLTLTADEAKFLAESQMPEKFDAQEIDHIVGDVIGLMDAEPSTRTGGTRTVAEVIPLPVTIPSTVATRTGGETGKNVEEDLFYIVNFENDEGYSVIAADRRIKDEIALFVGNGNLDENSDNPGLAVMLSRLDAYAARSIAAHEKWQDSVKMAMIDRLSEEYPEYSELLAGWLGSLQSCPQTRTPDYDWETEQPPIFVGTSYSYGPWTTHDRIGPMIPVEWGQGGGILRNNLGTYSYLESPFNRSVEDIFNEDYITELHSRQPPEWIPAGCVPIALVQIMAYWKHPTFYHGLNIDWDELCNWTGLNGNRTGRYKTWSGTMNAAPLTTQDLCADLIWYIGEDTDTDYGVGGSGTSSRKGINLLQDLGYYAPSRENYKYAPVLNSLNNHRPVYIHGSSEQILGIFPGDGHAWLIDGYLEQSRTKTTIYVYHILPLPNPNGLPSRGRIVNEYGATGTESREFFHNNFGWHGTDNGYYVPGIFDASEDYDDELPSNTRGDVNNYQYNLRVWTDINH